ncbi:cupin domain-containing carboxymuconolactone decarboxylase family protein [Puia dinghuensis]|uniref:4-carboxymuconolactone decarboxylase n=1 Tax=Puia dinghuensis TaxID=1792502 RepID=A0A8J2XUF6_9BACT|nr:carboxymuconolactone decarboxylase family protein [Puia dinghuensis]GGB25519.1 4-carboxymuconolactone decarboxylase [Puia dinghuensis]
MKINYSKIILVIISSLFVMDASAQSQGDSGALYTKGEKINSPNFTGSVWVNRITGPQNGVNCTVGCVSFEPGARTNWHSHPGGQILIVIEGTGYYQEEGKPRRIIRKGDVITCSPNVVHWHGASADTSMTHIAIGPDAAKGPAVWLKKVTDEEYAGPTAQNAMSGRASLNARQRSIVSIAAFTAKGDLQNLNGALNNGLNAGLTINEIKEILVQLYAYCGFPRSLNAINTFISALNERKAKGINDPIGVQPSPVNSDPNKYETGKNNLAKLIGHPENGPKTGYAEFVPVIDTFLKEHLFADIFSRGVLSYQERELTTISALVSLGGVESQLQGHMTIGQNIGITEVQLKEMLSILEISIGKKEADAGREVLSKVIGAKKQGS